jgi:hypothetical protein
MTSPGPDWVEQARRFVVSSGLAEALSAGRPAGSAHAPTDDRPSGHAAECRWCPVCAGLAALGGRRPDLVEGLADLLTTAAAVLRTHAGAPAATDPPAPAPADPAGQETPTPAPVQRIDVA